MSTIVDVHSHALGCCPGEMSDQFFAESRRAHAGDLDLTGGLRRVAAVEGIPGLDPLDRDRVEELIVRDALPLLALP